MHTHEITYNDVTVITADNRFGYPSITVKTKVSKYLTETVDVKLSNKSGYWPASVCVIEGNVVVVITNGESMKLIKINIETFMYTTTDIGVVISM